MNMKNPRNMKLVIQPVHSVMVHEYVFEGPCRFGSGEQLTLEFDRFNGAEGFKVFQQVLEEYLNDEAFELLEPVECEITESFEIPDALMAEVTKNDAVADCYLFYSVQRTYPVMLKTAEMTGKLIALQPKCCGSTMVPAMIRRRGYECISPISWEELADELKVYRARKILKNSRALLLTRAYTDAALVSAPDGALNLNDFTKIFGTQFCYLDVHEFLDQTQSGDCTANHTKPGIRGLNLTTEEMEEIGTQADELIKNATECTMTKEALVDSLRFYKTAEKMLEHYECNAFSAPCPEMCATRRLNENKYTPCLTHSLLNGQGICSACEYDVPGLITQMMLTAFSNSGSYLGNTTVVHFEKDGITPYLKANPANDLAEKAKDMTPEEREHLVYSFHSSINLQMRGFGAEPMAYAIHPYTGSEWGATFRHAFQEDKGQVITLARVSPDGKDLFVAKGTVVDGIGEGLNGCTQGIAFTVKDKYDFYKKQQNFGNHCPIVFGDCFDQMVALGRLLGLHVVTA